jgi:peptide methionine sulfoxide reductase msrA/msrB
MNNKVAIAFMIIFIVFAAISIINDQPDVNNDSSAFIHADYSQSDYEIIYFAGGCFWGVQAYFDNMLGVVYTDVGYINGNSENTSYFYLKDTEHAEAVQVVYDKEIISLEELVEYFYRVVDPTELNKQGADVGIQYRSGIYYLKESDLEVIEKVTQAEQEKYSKEIVTEIEPFKNYVAAEVEHQDYLIKKPSGYCHINLSNIPNEKPRINSKDYSIPEEEILREKLTDLQYMVTQQKETEPPFDNEYYTNKEKGLYVDIVSGEPLFLSIDKYESGSGWPSFTRPISREVLTYQYDYQMEYPRIEVRSRVANSHLGHVFDDGPIKEGSLRYCINSAALEFIPLEEFKDRGYEKFAIYFE